MATNAASTQSAPGGPLLQAGDRLSRDEFERRYQRMPPDRKAELIEGEVYMPSPVSHEKHGVPHAQLVTWLGVYQSHSPGVEVADNSTVRLDWDNEPQPDALLRVLPDCGGQTRDQDGYVTFAPEWVGEVAATSVSYDLHNKKEAYRRNGVREYLVWRVEDGALDWFVLRGGRYELLPVGDDGIYRSEVFPGLWLDAAALLQGDLPRVLDALQQGVRTDQHSQFVRELQARRTRPI